MGEVINPSEALNTVPTVRPDVTIVLALNLKVVYRCKQIDNITEKF